MTYKMNRERILSTFRVGLQSIVLAFVAVSFFVLVKFGVIHMHSAIPGRLNTAILVLFISTCVVWVPSFLMLLQYIRYSGGVDLDFTKDKGTRILTITIDKKAIAIADTEIMMIKKICSYPVAEQRISFIATDLFYYYKICRIGGDPFIIPCTVVGDELKDFYSP